MTSLFVENNYLAVTGCVSSIGVIVIASYCIWKGRKISHIIDEEKDNPGFWYSRDMRTSSKNICELVQEKIFKV